MSAFLIKFRNGVHFLGTTMPKVEDDMEPRVGFALVSIDFWAGGRTMSLRICRVFTSSIIFDDYFDRALLGVSNRGIIDILFAQIKVA